MATQVASQLHCDVHKEDELSPLPTERCFPPKLSQPLENSVVPPSRISNSQNLSGIIQTHLPRYTCTPLHKPPNTCDSKLESKVILCRSCSPPHDRMELPPRFKIVSPPLASTLNCPNSNITSLSCCPSTPSSNASLNCFPNLTPRSNSPNSKSTPSSIEPSLKFAPPTANCLQFLQPHPSQVIPSNKNCSQGSQPKKEKTIAKTPSSSEIPKQFVRPCSKTHSSQNQSPPKPMIAKPPPRNSSKPLQTTLPPSCRPQTPPSSSCKTAKPSDLPHPFPCTRKSPPIPQINKQLPQPIASTSKSYSCDHTKEIQEHQNKLNLENKTPSMPSCFNFSVPKTLSTCPECLTFCVGNVASHSQTIKATPQMQSLRPCKQLKTSTSQKSTSPCQSPKSACQSPKSPSKSSCQSPKSPD
ncbi:hypothetical protein KC19_12G010100 [Ceratodon purpureus]|uniref:Uncharacterized protein n=1 Tax=Ceratodon purpureus TaxID=3225 RepID=A0A8T0G2T1_CERPU|nr:hypothetical protein KC19_12G010100 [Ceratodon purpureus]